MAALPGDHAATGRRAARHRPCGRDDRRRLAHRSRCGSGASGCSRPRPLGAWHLHALTAGMPLDFFVFCSSVAGLDRIDRAGATTQPPTASSTRSRRQAGATPGRPLDRLGADRGRRLSHRRPDIARHLEQSGMRPIPLQAALDALGLLLRRTCDAVAVADIAAPLVARALPGTARAGYLAELLASDVRGPAAAELLLRARAGCTAGGRAWRLRRGFPQPADRRWCSRRRCRRSRRSGRRPSSASIC